ncbi:MAG: cupin domain-containing protein [Peptostreptococcaceae bacterium]|jgi:quercetin dioxygenase-like cupin family protein|nr:cupin domain-containing protein [Peptostreptococcaceae bacterium]
MIIVNSSEADIKEYPNHLMITGIVNSFEGNEVTIGTAIFKPNARVPEEGFGVHEFDEYSFVIEGELEAQIEDKHISLKADQFSYIAKGEKHWSSNMSEKDCKIVWVLVKNKK